MNPRLRKAGRALLGLSQAKLDKVAGLPFQTSFKAEAGDGLAGVVMDAGLQALGIEFLADGSGVRVPVGRGQP